MGNRTQTEIRSAANAVTAAQSQVFDELGRLLRELGASAQTTTHAYDKADNRTATTDPRGKLYGFAFDALNRLLSESDPALAQIAYSRDAADNLGAVTDARGNATSYVHNGWGEVIRETSPDRGITDYVRNAQGNVTQQTDARGVVSAYAYDTLGRVLTRSYAASPADNVQYFYDDVTSGNRGLGRLTRITDKSGETAFTYDSRGNVVREARVIAGKSYSTQFAYDAADNLITLTYPSGRSVSYARDALGRVSGVSTKLDASAPPVTVASSITYAPFGPLTGLTFGNGVALTQTYDQDYRLTGIAATGVQNLGYSYDASGNITAISDAQITSGKPAGDQSFAYDDLNRLTAANSSVYGPYAYSYDLAGNRIASSAGGVNEGYTYALSSNRLMSISGTPLAGAIPRSFTYDAAGNAANDNRGSGADYAYTHDSAGDMAQLDRDGLTLARYTSDARHLRVVKDLPGAAIPKTHFLYDADGNLLAEHDGVSGAVQNELIWLPAPDAGAGLPLAWQVTRGGTPGLYMVHADHLGQPQKLTDAAGAVVWDARFTPFGVRQVIYLNRNLLLNLRFPGQYADSESGLSYNWHRTYDPATGRYLQSDPIGLAGGINTYAYVNGNPVRYTDPQGLNPAAGAAMGGVAAGPPGAIVGGAIGLGLSIGALAILNEILDGADDPAGKAKADAQKAEEECEKDRCKEVKEQCIQGCSDFVLQKPKSRRNDLGGMDFHRCVRLCMDRNGC
ncbi:MAG: RHS repeat domain-containing protein [Pseudomonadota bacterium]